MVTTRRITSLALMITASVLVAQDTTATLTGRVTSKAGQPLAGVVVKVASPVLLGERTAVTDAKGVYRIPLLHTGTYTATFVAKDFATNKANFKLLAGETSRQDAILMTLKEMTANQQAVVEVIAYTPQMDKTETTTQTNFSQEELEKLTATSIFAAAYLAPGVDTSGSTGAGAPSIRGGSNVGTKILLNGAQVNDGGFSNWSITPTIPDMVDSMAVIQSPLNARYGGTDGGIMAWTTTRGSNEWSGTIRRNYYRSDWNGAAGVVRSASGDWQYNNAQYGPNGSSENQTSRTGVFAPGAYQAPDGAAQGLWEATFKGPLWKDHVTFAYATRITPTRNSPELFHNNTGSVNDAIYTAYTDPSTGQFYSSGGYGTLEGKTMPWSTGDTWNQYVLYAQINENHQVDFSYTQENSFNTDYRSNDPSGAGQDKFINTILSIGYKGLVGASGVLDVRYGLTKRQWEYGSSTAPAIKEMTGVIYGSAPAANLMQLWENYTPFLGVSGNPSDPGDGQKDTTFDLNYQHIINTSEGSHIIDGGMTYHGFEWNTPSPTGMTQNVFQGPGMLNSSYGLNNSYIVFNYNALVNDIAPGYAPANQNVPMYTGPYGAANDMIPTLFQGQGEANAPYWTRTLGYYLNDLWTINKHHSIMLGLRDDVFKGWDTTHTVLAYSQITPRFEYKFDLAGDQKRILNLSYGQFHQPLNGGIIQAFIQSRYAYQTVKYWTGTVNPSPNTANPNAPYLVSEAAFTNPANYGEVVNYTAPGVDRIDAHVKGMTNDEFTVGYRRNFDNGGSLRLTYVNRNWKNLYDWFPDAAATKFTDPYDTTASVYGLSRTLRIDPNARRRYNSFETEWSLPLAKRLDFGGNYVYGRFTGNDNENLTSVPYNGIKGQPDSANWNQAYYNQYYNQAGAQAAPDELRRPVHHLKGWFSYDLGSGKVKQAITLRAFFTSGQPFNPSEAYGLPAIVMANYQGGSRLPTNPMYVPVGGPNQYSTQPVTEMDLHYTLDVPIYRKLTWFFTADLGNVFQHIVTNNYNPGNFNGSIPSWNPAAGPAAAYANGWATATTLTTAASTSGYRTVSLETGIRF